MLPTREPGTPWLVRNARVILVVTFTAAVTMQALWPYGNQVDMQVYQAAADALLNGRPLYSQGVLGGMHFTYPPFAAVLFLPLAVVWLPLLHVVWALGNLTLLTLIVRRGCSRFDLPPEMTVVFLGLALWLDPIRTSLDLGQINILLLGLVVFDLCRRRPSRWAGVGVGLAAGLKLTPLIFVVYLLFARRWREAAVALSTFAVTVGIGLLFVPEATQYWIGGIFGDSSRIGPLAHWYDQSIHGMLARVLGQPQSTVCWLLLGGGVALVGTASAALVDRRGDRLLALGLCGMTACAVSPFSWDHHWVWLLPVIIAFAGHQWHWWTVVLTCFAWPTALLPIDFRHSMPTGIFSIEFEGPLAFLVRNTFVWTLVAVLAVVLMRYRQEWLQILKSRAWKYAGSFAILAVKRKP